MNFKQRINVILGIGMATKLEHLRFINSKNIMAIMFAVITQAACTPDPIAIEESLRNQFTAKEMLLNKIVEMQKQDAKVVRIAPTFTRLENDWSWPREDIGFSEARWKAYREIFDAVGSRTGTEKDGQSIFIHTSKSTRGFAYVVGTTPSRVVRSFSECDFAKDERTCFIPIKGNWYIYFG